jgi:hypothetical protein
MDSSFRSSRLRGHFEIGPDKGFDSIRPFETQPDWPIVRLDLDIEAEKGATPALGRGVKAPHGWRIPASLHHFVDCYCAECHTWLYMESH